ncbi:hypothetical protein KEM55_006465 [Ascosphaera atra]|nr:hypothetical protein KEM55_006465 [Ascosphaera atra]
MESAPPIDHPTSANVVSTWLNTYHDPAEKTIQYIGEIRDPEIKHEVVNATTQYVEQSYSQIVINKMPPELKARFCEENGLVNGDGHECTVDAIRWLQSVQSW